MQEDLKNNPKKIELKIKLSKALQLNATKKFYLIII